EVRAIRIEDRDLGRVARIFGIGVELPGADQRALACGDWRRLLGPGWGGAAERDDTGQRNEHDQEEDRDATHDDLLSRVQIRTHIRLNTPFAPYIAYACWSRVPMRPLR